MTCDTVPAVSSCLYSGVLFLQLWGDWKLRGVGWGWEELHNGLCPGTGELGNLQDLRPSWLAPLPAVPVPNDLRPFAWPDSLP